MENVTVIKNNQRSIKEVNIGDAYFPVIVTHVGVSALTDSLNLEREKIKRAVSAGANMIEDLSLVGNISEIQKRLLEDLSVPLAAVSIYEIYSTAKSSQLIVSEDYFIRVVEEEMKRGVDMLTIHATVLKDDVDLLRKTNRLIPCTSRGGTMLLELMNKNHYENPFYVYFDQILQLAKKYSVYISLGPCYRPGSVVDCYLGETLHTLEIERMSELVKRAREKGIGIAVEGIGHAPLNVIPELVVQSKRKCFNAPYRVMPVATDIALGYDHISSAIASATAVMYGANSIACVSRAEHIGLPTIDDVEEAVVSAKIAAYCGYAARTGDFSMDKKLSLARQRFGCIGKPEFTLFPEGARRAIEKYDFVRQNKECTMCGEFCALNTSERVLRD